MRLSKDDIALLRTLDKEKDQDTGAGEAQAGTEAPAHLTEAPKALFELNLINRLVSGDIQITKTGSRALFQAECIEALEQTLAGLDPAMSGGVERWLLSSGFLHAADKTVTSRGKLWLASLTPEQHENADGATEQQAPQGAQQRLPGELAQSRHVHHAHQAHETASAESFAARRGAA
ncbi:MAG: hypothetical protein ACJ8HI_09620 [Massilia sp.]